jgi:hypothetical protein
VHCITVPFVHADMLATQLALPAAPAAMQQYSPMAQ